MTELWKSIAANSGRVPGLRVNGPMIGLWFQVRFDGCVLEGHPESRSSNQRAALMLIVDAIEAAGLARFERQIVNLGVRWIAKRIEDVDGNPIPAPLWDEPLCREHIALSTVIAKVLEQLPEGKA